MDGKEADIILIGDCMIAVQMSEGNHTLSLRYHNEAFSLGWKISLVCVIIFVALTYGAYAPKPHKGKYERKDK